MGQQLVAIESKAGPSFIRLVQVNTFIPSHNKLGILGWICQGRAAQGAAMGIQLYFRILLVRQSVALSNRKQEHNRLVQNLLDQLADTWCLQCFRGMPTYKYFFQSGNKQMCNFCHLAEGQACDGAAPLMQSQSFTVTVSGDVPFG